MTKELERPLTQDELRYLTQTIIVQRESVRDDPAIYRPKVRYIAKKGTSILKIMGGAAYALQQKGLDERADELRRLILSGAYGQPADALELIGNYVRLKIVDEEGKELGSTE